ncbi:hypothetical protein HKX48_001247 [Thoreauomyces humboldtii]|nr:hypothetical protein HKX48_001247 [Thoreauomyces humboldtii]
MSRGKRPWDSLIGEVHARIPFYLSDWTDGFADKKVLAAGIYIFFANVAPAITFAFVLGANTNGSIGVEEVLLSSAISGITYSILAGQPLVIVGVTGPTTVFVTTIHTLSSSLGVAFLPFLGWTTLWSAVMHIALGILGVSDLIRHVTRFTCEIFGGLIAVVYFWNGVAEIVRGFGSNFAFDVGLMAILLAILTLFLAHVLSGARSWRFWSAGIRAFVADYAIPAAVLLATVVSVASPRIRNVGLDRLDVPYDRRFLSTTSGRSWVVDFTNLSVGGIFASALSGVVLTILFTFDHNVSSLLSQRPESHLRKPPAFNYDLVILGLTMIPCAILGLPSSNGLIPQAPLHVAALSKIRSGKVIHVAEQRVSNLMQSLLTIVLLIPSVLSVVRWIPRAVLAGLFLAMGIASLGDNQFACRLFSLFSDKENRLSVLRSSSLNRVPRFPLSKFTILQLSVLILLVSLTESNSPAALGFPVIIAALVPFRYYLLPRLVDIRWLRLLDSNETDVASEDTADELGVDVQNDTENSCNEIMMDGRPPDL